MSTRRRLAVSLVAAAAAAGAVPLFVGSGTSGAAPAPAGCPSNPSYDYTIPTPVGPPNATSTADGNVAYAALGADKKLYYVESSIAGDPLAVSPLACLGGQAIDSPAVVDADGGDTSAFFVTAANGTIYQRYATTNFSSLGAFTPVNNATTTNGPAAVQTPDGQYHLFVRGTNGALYHGFKQSASASSWRFESLGGNIVGPVSAVIDGSRVLVAATTPTGSIYTISGTNFAWGPWTKIVNQVAGNSPTQVLTKTTPSLVRNPETGAITLYAAHQNFGLFAISKQAGAGFTGALWFRIDSLLPSDARIAAATDGTNSIVYARFLDRPSGQTITAYTQFTAATNSWSAYFLAPYTCFNCNPLGVDTTAKSASASKASPGAGKMSTMPKTKKVLG